MSKIKLDNNPMLNPVPIIIVGTTANGRANYTTVGAFGVVCLEPIFYISLKNTHCSTAAIRESGFFSVNLSTPALIQKTDYCGMVSGNTVDKSNVFTAFYDKLGNAPMIKESPMNYLCKVANNTPVKDFEVFFGEIIATYINEDCLVDGKPDTLKINPIVGMRMTYYGLGDEVGKVFTVGKGLM